MLYYLMLLVLTPMIPLMYIQGKLISRKIPDLPEAKGPEGIVKAGDESPDNKVDVLFLGESTMAGVGVEFHKDGFAGVFAEELSKDTNKSIFWKVRATSGFTAKDVYEKTLPKIVDIPADLIIIGLGGNDTFNLNHPVRWSFQISKLIDSLQSSHKDIPVVFLNMPPVYAFPAFTKLLKITMGSLVKILGHKLEAISTGYENVFFNSNLIILEEWGDLYDVAGYENVFFSDGVHPSQLTYDIWAREMVKFVIHNKIIAR